MKKQSSKATGVARKGSRKHPIREHETVRLSVRIPMSLANRFHDHVKSWNKLPDEYIIELLDRSLVDKDLIPKAIEAEHVEYVYGSKMEHIVTVYHRCKVHNLTSYEHIVSMRHVFGVGTREDMCKILEAMLWNKLIEFRNRRYSPRGTSKSYLYKSVHFTPLGEQIHLPKYAAHRKAARQRAKEIYQDKMAPK